ncbi:hypothetical protein SAY87_027945 [Trapa incisa]|uniref:Protein BIC1 n=1 Tax=Trapa incisa TaxID=236973 RepID=A0AAN7L166_9MYRT|nr:hypothetical protein SAY87_027945 [Trapa incisa]
MSKELEEMSPQLPSDRAEIPKETASEKERTAVDEHKISSQKGLSRDNSLDKLAMASTEDENGHRPAMMDENGHERLKRHRTEVAGRVWIPDVWGQEDLLMDWVDCRAFDSPLVSGKITSARAALVEEGRRASTGRLRIENRC